VSACLLDGNVLVALCDAAHVHHEAARKWFVDGDEPFATCPITQGTLMRMLLRNGAVDSPAEAAEVLRRLCAHPRHRFWPDQLPYAELAWERLQGHRQVTDAYLAALARTHQGRLATFDKGLAALHADVAELIAFRGT
jgi:toxin-antitoxin system PIN domain toxin